MKIRAFVSKKKNSVWSGWGDVVSFPKPNDELDKGVVIIHMTSGKMKGHTGGFDITGLKFQTIAA